MSTQIGPGLRDYLTALEARLAASASSPDRCWSCRATAAPSPRARRPAVGDQHGRLGAHRRCRRIASPLGRQLGHRNIISTDVGGTTFLVGLIVDGEPVRATTHGDQPPSDQRADPAGRRDRLRRRRDRLARRGRQPADRAAQRAGRARAGLLRAGRHRADQHRRQPGARHPPRARPARRPQAAVRRAGRARPSTPRSPKPLGPVRRGGRRGDLRGAERADRRPAAQDRRRGGPRPARLRALRLRRRRPGALRPLRRRGRRRRGRRAARASRVGVLRLRARVLGHRAGRRAVRPDCSSRSTRRGSSATSPSWRRGCATALDRQGVRFARVELHREIDMRYAMQLAEVTAPVRGGALDAAGDRGAAAGFEQRYAALYGAGVGFPRGRHPGDHLPGPRRRGRCRSPRAARRARRVTDDPADGALGSRPVCLDADRRASSTPPSTTTAQLRAGHVLTGPGDRRGADDHRRRARRSHRHASTARQPDHPLRWERRRDHARSPAPRCSPAAPSTRTSCCPLAAAALPAAHRHPGADRRPRPADLRGGPAPALVGHRRDGRGAQAHVRLADRHRRQRLRLRDQRRARPGGAGRALQHDARRRRRPRHLLDARGTGRPTPASPTATCSCATTRGSAAACTRTT